MKLNLTRPLAFFDLETTGTQVAEDRIVEISILKVHPDGREEVRTHLVNPTVPIPKGATEVHGITDDKVANAPTFAQLAAELKQFLSDCDLGGFNSNRFDIPLLVEEFYRAGVEFEMKGRRTVDAQVIFHRMEERTLGAAMKFYCGRELEGAHSAEADIRATYEVLKAQLDRYSELRNDVAELHEFSSRGNKFVDFAGHVVRDAEGTEVFNFGKHKGRAVAEVFAKEPSYYAWMMDSQFPHYTKKVITEIRLRSQQQA
jgi:DNA polymerase-3 subunit epsilon